MTTSDGNFVEYRSFVNGYHDYISSWSPFIGEELVLWGQPDNEHDLYAVAVINNEVVGHIPRTISKVVCFFLHYDGNEGYCVITGAPLNRRVGLGLEVPCLYMFCGKSFVEI